jgi:sulfur carrier protein
MTATQPATTAITLNGRPTRVTAGLNLADLLASLGAPHRGVALALDGEVVPRQAWHHTTVGDGARVEVVTALQGG